MASKGELGQRQGKAANGQARAVLTGAATRDSQCQRCTREIWGKIVARSLTGGSGTAQSGSGGSGSGRLSGLAR
jgi:hypothetical protein